MGRGLPALRFAQPALRFRTQPENLCSLYAGAGPAELPNHFAPRPWHPACIAHKHYRSSGQN
jgi:hypothetical protein